MHTFRYIALLSLIACATRSERVAATSDALAGEIEFDLRPAAPLAFPGSTDSNSPAHWSNGTFVLFNSELQARRSTGSDIAQMSRADEVTFVDREQVNGYRWIEATFKDEDGTLYGWYHNEPFGLCPGTSLTAPRIGALRSTDDGATWTNLGVVLEAPGPLNCDAQNGYFAGGNGDFSVMLDRDKEYFYFYASSMVADEAQQGVIVARMRYSDRDAPSGKVARWYRGAFGSPGLGGKSTPILPATRSWANADPDAYWGPSIHYNVHLDEYVILVNHTQGGAGDWKQEGSYVMFAKDVADPDGWSAPKKVVDGDAWYPQVIGAPEHGTDKLAGRVARLFVHGESEREIVFRRRDETAGGCASHGRMNGMVLVDGQPKSGVLVSAWGHDRGDVAQATTNPFGWFAIEGLDEAEQYNVVADGETHDNIVIDSANCWTRHDFLLSR